MKIGIYVHIPFCKSRCIYCGFYSTTKTELGDRYTDCLIKEMQIRKDKYILSSNTHSSLNVDTIYLGGGTPSTLDTHNVERIINSILSIYGGNPREITVEMNPDDITDKYVRALKSFGVNRVSMGIQTFCDERLKFIHRRHTSAQAIRGYETLLKNGIENVSIDLMFGFPGETIEDWKYDIAQAVKLNPKHISAYSLMYEEGTMLYRMLKQHDVSQVDEELSLEMYSSLMDKLSAYGYEHYEISNFALDGYRSIHNSSYWHDVPYIGVGASAHSYIGKYRMWNINNIDSYMSSIESGILPIEQEFIDQDTHYNDLVTTTMRTFEGLDLNLLDDKYKEFAIECAKNDIKNGLLELKANHLRLTRKGLFVSDMVMSDLIKI